MYAELCWEELRFGWMHRNLPPRLYRAGYLCQWGVHVADLHAELCWEELRFGWMHRNLSSRMHAAGYLCRRGMHAAIARFLPCGRFGYRRGMPFGDVWAGG